MAKITPLAKSALYTENVSVETNEDISAWLWLGQDVTSTNLRSNHYQLMGEILTLAEIALPEGQQLKAFKDQIKAAFNRTQIANYDEIAYTFRQLSVGFGIETPGPMDRGLLVQCGNDRLPDPNEEIED